MQFSRYVEMKSARPTKAGYAPERDAKREWYGRRRGRRDREGREKLACLLFSEISLKAAQHWLGRDGGGFPPLPLPL